MRKSLLLKALLLAAFPMFAIEDETASAAPSSTEPAADAVAAPVADATAVTTQVQIDPPVDVLNTATATPVVDASAPPADAPAADEVAPEAPAANDESQAPADGTPVDTGEGDAVAAAPIVQTPTPVAQSGGVGDPVLETVKTPAHNVAEEIQEQIKKLEQLPAEVAAWFESKFIELAGHIKALL